MVFSYSFLKRFTYYLLFLCFSFNDAFSEKNPLAQKLELAIQTAKSDSSKFRLYNSLFLELRSNNPSQALVIAQQHFSLAKSKKRSPEIAQAYSNMGLASYSLGNYSDALNFGTNALKIRESLGDKQQIAASLSNIALVYGKQEQLALALKYSQNALSLREEIKDKHGLSSSYNNLGLIYIAMKNDSLGLINYFKSLELRSELDDKKGKAQALNNIATVYLRQNLPEKALVFLFQSIGLKKELNDRSGLASSYNNVGDVYFKKGDLNKSQSDYFKAIQFYTKSLTIARELKLKEVVKVCCQSLSEVYDKISDYKNSYLYYKEYSLLKDSMSNEHIMRTTTEIQSKYQSEKQQKEIAVLNKDKLIATNTEKTQRVIIVCGIVFTIISLGFLLNRYYVKQRANSLLSHKNKLIDQSRSELKKQKEIIEQKNRDINDSIEYAMNVQNLIMPTENELKTIFPDSFVLFRPKSVVSGDFYWIHRTASRILIAVIDCTGHGIPGAMMSFLGFNLLENVVKSKLIEEPHLILAELNAEVFSTLSKKNENLNSKYGMDISIVAIDTAKRELHFAGAHHSLYLIRNGELTDFKGDKFSIGTLFTGAEKQFTPHRIFYNADDCIYLFSDGFVDQIGGTDRKKFYYAPFKKLLIDNSGLAMSQQKEHSENTYLKWRGEREQTDDLLLIGIRL